MTEQSNRAWMRGLGNNPQQGVYDAEGHIWHNYHHAAIMGWDSIQHEKAEAKNFAIYNVNNEDVWPISRIIFVGVPWVLLYFYALVWSMLEFYRFVEGWIKNG